tara:strand:- start:504 stop:761 length:258 start_codon:yes stop_codon:yes gene_type:complete
MIPPNGATVENSSFFARFVNRGDLLLVLTNEPDPTPAPVASAPASAPVTNYTKAQLLKKAKKAGLKASSKMTKTELLALLKMEVN